MSNSIWKTGSPKGIHEEDRLGDYYVAEFHREDGSSFYEAGGTCDICGIPDRWTFLTDLIAQADKAERLEKENEAMREEFEVWHGNYKCVVEDLEIARKALEDITKERYVFTDWFFKAVTMTSIAEKALEQIEHKKMLT